MKHSTWSLNPWKSGYSWRHARGVSKNCIWKQTCQLVLSTRLRICIFKPMKDSLSCSLFLGQDVIEFKNISQSPYVHSASLWASFQSRVPQKCKEIKINFEGRPDFLSLTANLQLNNLHSLEVAVSQQPGTICISLAYQQHLKRHKWHLEWQKSNTLGLQPPAPRITNTS